MAMQFNLFNLGDALDPDKRRAHAERGSTLIGNNNVDHGLKQLQALSASHGFDYLMVIWPRFADAIVHTAPHRRGEAIARARQVPFAPLLPYFIAHYQRYTQQRNQDGKPVLTPAELYTTAGDGMHPNELGAQVGADAMAEILRSLRVEPGSSR